MLLNYTYKSFKLVPSEDKNSILDYVELHNINMDNYVVIATDYYETCKQFILVSRDEFFKFFSSYLSGTLGDIQIHFYEIISSEYTIPYFDCDLANDTIYTVEMIRDEVLSFMEAAYENFNRNIAKLTIYNSSTYNKTSYHILIHGVLVQRSRLGKLLQTLDSKKLFDTHVYKSRQLFRTIGSSKYGKTNTKILVYSDFNNTTLQRHFVNIFPPSDKSITLIERGTPLGDNIMGDNSSMNIEYNNSNENYELIQDKKIDSIRSTSTHTSSQIIRHENIHSILGITLRKNNYLAFDMCKRFGIFKDINDIDENNYIDILVRELQGYSVIIDGNECVFSV